MQAGSSQRTNWLRCGEKEASAIYRRSPAGGHQLVGFSMILDDRSQSGLKTGLELPP